MATATAVTQPVAAGVFLFPVKTGFRKREARPLVSAREFTHSRCWNSGITFLRRACERQKCFAFERAESVANVAAIVSPVAFFWSDH